MNNIEWIEHPDGSVTTSKWEQKIDERTKVLAEALFELQKRAPAGQMRNLHSYGCCQQMAEELNDKLHEWELTQGRQHTPYNL